MAQISWDPIEDMLRFRSEMDDIFNSFFEDSSRVRKDYQWAPPADVIENEDAVYLVFELPGVRKEDVNISVKDDTLVVRGGKRRDSTSEEEKYHIAERKYGSFERQFALLENIDKGDINASLKNGILKIKLAKVKKEKPREVEIKVS